MSGRIRTIKPELLEDAVSAGLSDMAFRIFVSSLVLADDYGRMRAEPGWLMGQIYWARTVQVEYFIAALGELGRLMHFYEVNGQRYAAVRNWSKHQKVSHPGKPRIPEPPETLARPTGPPPPLERPSGESPETLVPDLRPTTYDHGPPTGDLPRAGACAHTREEQDPGPSPDIPSRFEIGTAGAFEAAAVYESAIAEATGKPYALLRAPYVARDVCLTLNGHAPPGSPRDALAWLAATVAEWVASVDAQFTAGWKPAKLLDWLNAGRPDKRQTEPPKSRVHDTPPAPYHAKAIARVDPSSSRDEATAGAAALLGALGS
jgi:hypothetical protein